MEPSIDISPSADATALDHETPMRVLLVEDDDGDALIVEEELELSGARVALERTRTLSEAAAAPLERFDCVLLDLNLPDAEGLEALQRLRALAPHLAVLVLTGLDDERRGTEAVAAGAQDYLLKGAVSGVLLARALRYAVERRRAEQTSRQLSIAQLEARENARLERGLLPTPLVRDPTLTLATHYRPGRRRALLGGDFFDAVQAPDGTVHAVIGDVCGHGPDEAALGVCLRIAWRTLVMAGAPVDRLLPLLQDVLVVERHAPQVFTTLCMASLAPDRDQVSIRLAGHPPPLLLRGDERSGEATAGGEASSRASETMTRPPAEAGKASGRGRVRALEPGPPGPPLGVLDDAGWPAYITELPPSWALLLFTDGLMDGRVGEGPERLGESGLAQVVGAAAAAAGDEPQELVRLVVERAEDLNAGPLIDDVALLLIARLPA